MFLRAKRCVCVGKGLIIGPPYSAVIMFGIRFRLGSVTVAICLYKGRTEGMPSGNRSCDIMQSAAKLGFLVGILNKK